MDEELNKYGLTDSQLMAVGKMAQRHWEWLSEILEKVFIDAFIHGYKHGIEDSRK